MRKNEYLEHYVCSGIELLCSTTCSSSEVNDLNSVVSSAKMFTVLLIESGMPFMNTTKKVGPSTLPWGMPLDMDHSRPCKVVV